MKPIAFTTLWISNRPITGRLVCEQKKIKIDNKKINHEKNELSLEKRLGQRGGQIDLKVISESIVNVLDTILSEPRGDDVYSLACGSNELVDLIAGQVLSVRGALRITDSVENLVQFVQVLLLERKGQMKGFINGNFPQLFPTSGDVRGVARLENTARDAIGGCC